MRQPTYAEIAEYVTQQAQAAGVPPELALAQMHQESRGIATARSPKGAIGPMQLMPGTAKLLGVDPNDWQQNVQGGVKYLRQQLDRFGDPKLALAAYNAGPEAVAKYNGVPPFKETQNYVTNILSEVQGGLPNVNKRRGTGGVQMAKDDIPSFDELETAARGASPQKRQPTEAAPSTDIPSFDELEKAAQAGAPKPRTKEKQKESSFFDALKRGAGITAGSVAQGVTDLPLALNDLALQYVQNPLARVLGLPEAKPLAQTRDEFLARNLPQPETAGERIVASGIRQGAGALTPAGAAGVVAKTATGPVTKAVAGSLAANPVAQGVASGVGGAAGQTATELGYGDGVSTGANLAASVLATFPAQRLANARAGNFTPDGQRAMALDAAAKKEGVQLSAGDLGSRTAQTIENFIQDMPFTGRDNFMREQAQQTKRMLEGLRARVPSGEPGREMVDAIKTAYDAKRTQAGQLYDSVTTELAKVPGTERVPTTQFSSAAKQFLKQYPKYLEGADVPTDVKNILTAAANANLKNVEYQTLRDLRTLIGTEVRAAQRQGKTISGELSQLYKNLQRDFNSWATTLEKSNPDAATAYKTADKYFRENVVPFKADSKIGKIVRSTTTDDELNILADSVMGSLFKAGNKGKAELALKLTGKPGETIAQRELLNRALDPALDPTLKAGVSPMRFVNTLNMDDPMTQAVMSRNSALAGDVNRIADVAEATRRSVSAFETPRTGVQNKALGTVVGLANPATMLPTAGGLLAGNALQRALRTDPVKELLFSQGATPAAFAFPTLLPLLRNAGQFE